VFEEGVRLSRLLHERLNEAERKVEILMSNKDGERVPVPFAAVEDAGRGGSGPRAAAGADGDESEDEDDTTEDDAGEQGATGGHGQSALPF
jgi:hypothetical protein